MAEQLPVDIQQRIQLHLAQGVGKNSDEILRRALDALDWQNQECRAIQEGLADMEAGRVRAVEDFDSEFRARHDITSDA